MQNYNKTTQKQIALYELVYVANENQVVNQQNGFRISTKY